MMTIIMIAIILIMLVYILWNVGFFPLGCYGLICIEVSPYRYLYLDGDKQRVYTLAEKPLCRFMLVEIKSIHEKIALLRDVKSLTTGEREKRVTDFLKNIADRVNLGCYHHSNADIDFETTCLVEKAFNRHFESYGIYSIVVKSKGAVVVRFRAPALGDKAINVNVLEKFNVRWLSENLPYINYVGGCPFVFYGDTNNYNREPYGKNLCVLLDYVFANLLPFKEEGLTPYTENPHKNVDNAMQDVDHNVSNKKSEQRLQDAV